MSSGPSNRTTLFIVALSLLLALPLAAQDASSCERPIVEELIFDGASQSDIDAYLSSCSDPTAISFGPDKQTTIPVGSVFYEEIDACAYHPQRREFTCSIEVKQRFGFAGTPGVGPGSWEWTLACVDFGAGLVPINLSAVHVHDEPFGVGPSWYYSTTVQANPQLHTALVNGQSLKARLILAWTQQPNVCNFVPIWGNWADFKIKLDP
jgi:hypothetical protein